MTNPERDQDRAEDLLDNWRKYGYAVFPQQRRIYQHIASHLRARLELWSVLEAGCGAGVGTAILSRPAAIIVGTDKLEANVCFARELYPWIAFDFWDIQHPWHDEKADMVVAVEVLEHVADPQKALANLIDAARFEVWISTPNGSGKPRPPENELHVQEYTPAEVLDMIGDRHRVEILGWEDLSVQGLDTEVSPLVYRIVV